MLLSGRATTCFLGESQLRHGFWLIASQRYLVSQPKTLASPCKVKQGAQGWPDWDGSLVHCSALMPAAGGVKARLLGPAHNRHETSPSREGGREAAYLQGDLGVADLLLLAFVMLGDAQVQLVVGLLQLQDTPCQDGQSRLGRPHCGWPMSRLGAQRGERHTPPTSLLHLSCSLASCSTSLVILGGGGGREHKIKESSFGGLGKPSG